MGYETTAAPTFLETVRKAVVAGFATASTGVALLATSDFTTVGGIVTAGATILASYGVFKVKNAT